jgi:hypothetical protein
MTELFNKFMSWLWGMVKDFFLWVLDGLVDFLVAILNLIPVPDFLDDLGDNWSNLSGAVGYWVGPFELGYGVTVILSAYAARFVLRRIPFIG